MPGNIPPESLALYGSAAAGLCALTLSADAIGALRAPRAGRADLDVFEYERRTRLREGSLSYRWFEPIIDPMARRPAAGKEPALARIGRDLALTGVRPPWRPGEYVAAKQVDGIFIGLAVLLITFVATSSPLASIVLALACGLGYGPLSIHQLRANAEARLLTIRRRLPFVMDLIALTMEAGASFLESLQTAVRENALHPLGAQFAEVLRDISVGRTRRESLEAMMGRLGDPDVSEIIFAIIKGEELGTPLSLILRNQADQIRLKRSQWAEKAAAEAQVSIIFPGLLIMVACLLVVLAPFVLSVVPARN